MKTFAGKVLTALAVVTLTFLSAMAAAEIRSEVDRRTISMGAVSYTHLTLPTIPLV